MNFKKSLHVFNLDILSAWLEFELDYFVIAAQLVSHYLIMERIGLNKKEGQKKKKEKKRKEKLPLA